MDYFSIIKHAFKINLKNRFLWIFGILAGGSVGFSSFNYQMDNTSFKESWSKFSNQSVNGFDLSTFWTTYGAVVIALITVLLVLSIIFFILNLVSQAALVAGVTKLESGDKTDFFKSFNLGLKSFWRVWALNITLLLAVLIALSVLVIPTCLLVIAGSYVSAAVIGFILLILNLAFWLLVAYISPYALRIVVLRKISVYQSIRQSLHFVRDNLAEVTVMYLLLMAISFAIGVLAVLVIIILSAILVLIGYGLFQLSLVVAFVYGLVVAIALLAVIIAFSGGYSSFQSSVITLNYLKLINRTR